MGHPAPSQATDRLRYTNTLPSQENVGQTCISQTANLLQDGHIGSGLGGSFTEKSKENYVYVNQ